MRRFAVVFLFLLSAALAAAAGPARARMLGDPTVPFSADRQLTVGERSFSGKVYVIPGSQRHEQTIEGIDQVVILHGDMARGWLILPGLNSFVEFGFAPAAAELSESDLLSTVVGQETIEGRRTTKYRIEHTARDGTEVDGYLWLTAEGIPMRLDGSYTTPKGRRAVTVKMRLSHVRQGPQDPALFVVPQNMIKLPTAALTPLLGGQRGG